MTVSKLLATLGMFMIGLGLVIALDERTNPAAAWLCTYKTHIDSGVNRICIYKCPTGESAITIRISQWCPISIDG